MADSRQRAADLKIAGTKLGKPMVAPPKPQRDPDEVEWEKQNKRSLGIGDRAAFSKWKAQRKANPPLTSLAKP